MAAHVVYGVVGFKTHTKMILVVRRNGRGLRSFVHIGTGNYHPRTALLGKIAREADNARQGLPARIIIKVNSLTEPQAIQALYRAAMDGVEIDLIVRGICCLRPGIADISENIRVRSVVGRFLEHTRAFYFHNNANPEVFCASADWMERNFFRRVETAFPVSGKRLRDRLIRELEYYLQDNTQAWLLQSDGQYCKAKPAEGETAFSAQHVLPEKLAET